MLQERGYDVSFEQRVGQRLGVVAAEVRRGHDGNGVEVGEDVYPVDTDSVRRQLLHS